LNTFFTPNLINREDNSIYTPDNAACTNNKTRVVIGTSID